MKKFVFFTFLCLSLLFCSFARADENAPFAKPEDNPYDIMKLELTPVISREDDSNVDFLQHILGLVKMYTYFNRAYPGDLIDTDFSEEVKRLFPDLSTQEAFDREENIRFVVKSFRVIDSWLEKVIGEMMLPEEPPLIVDAEDYDTLYTADYIENDKLVVILDLKKVLAYGSDRRNFEAIEAKIEREKLQNSSVRQKFQEMKNLLSRLEFKKIPFYGIIYPDPFTGRLGIGDWVKKDNIGARIISDTSYLGKQEEIRGAINFMLPQGTYLDDSQKQKLKIDFSGSENLQSYQVLWPAPVRLINEKYNIPAYVQNFAIPVLFQAEDVQKPLHLHATLDGNFCNQQGCQQLTFAPELVINKGKASETTMHNFIQQSYNLLPKKQNSDLEIKEVVMDQSLEENQPSTLRIILQSSKPVFQFDIFVESPDGLEFGIPKININDKKITVRMDFSGQTKQAIGKELNITAKTDVSTVIRQEHTIKTADFFDIDNNQLSIGLILLAVLGGFILNIMPCVFPVLSLKLLAITQFGGSAPAKIRRGFSFTIAGIFTAFAGLIIFLISLKSLGYSIGWGMQFQNTSFLAVMTFVITLFMGQIMGLISINTPQWVNKILDRKTQQEDLLNFLTGLFLVLLATPCSAPYLGTALGFALAGSNFDIMVIMGAVAFGLALPYLLLTINPNLAIFVPHPGSWLRQIVSFMVLMLFLTIIWLLSILYVQTSAMITLRMILYLSVFLFLLWFRKVIMETIERQNVPLEIKQKTRRIFNFIFEGLSLLLLAIGIWDVRGGYQQKRLEVMAQRQVQLNKEQIQELLKQDKIVLVSIGADWCLTCKYNDVTVINNYGLQQAVKQYNVEIIEIDWTNYNEGVLNFMAEYGRKGLPFYVIYSKRIPNGMVLPEMLNEKDLVEIIRAQRQEY